MNYLVIVTQQIGEKRSQKKEMHRAEHVSEIGAWGDFTSHVQQYCSLAFAAVNPVSITMKDSFGTIFATFQTR